MKTKTERKPCARNRGASKRVGSGESVLLSGAERVAMERARQMAAEGWTPEHDDKHRGMQLTLAAISYACAVAEPDEWAAARDLPPSSTHHWPWAEKWWKPSNDPVRNLEKAGALICAEIDRLLRARRKTGQENT